MGTLGYSVNEAFFFFKVKYIEKKKIEMQYCGGILANLFSGFYSIIGFIRLLFLSSLEVLMYSSTKEFKESLYSGAPNGNF